MNPLVHRKHGCGHGYIDILPLPVQRPSVESCQNADRRFKARIDVRMRERVMSLGREIVTHVSQQGGGKPGFRMYRRCVGRAMGQRTALPISADRRIDDFWIPLNDVLIIETEECQRARPEILDDDIGVLA